MTHDDVLEPVAAIPQAKNIEYGSAYNLAPGLFGIPAHVGIMVCKTDTGPAEGVRGWKVGQKRLDTCRCLSETESLDPL